MVTKNYTETEMAIEEPLEFTIPMGRLSIRRRYDAIDFRLGEFGSCRILVATAYFLLTGFYGWAVFKLPVDHRGIPSASLFPSLAGLFRIANLIDIYVTTSEIPPQEQNWDMPDPKL